MPRRRARGPQADAQSGRRAGSALGSRPSSVLRHYRDASALRPRRQSRSLPERALPSPGARDGYATGRCMCNGTAATSVLGRACHADGASCLWRARQFHSGDGEVAPGVTVHRVGGHSDGLQVVRVETARGPVVLASDAAHYYANLQRRSPFPIVYNVGDMAEGWETIERLAGHPDRFIPGHDPIVTRDLSACQRQGRCLGAAFAAVAIVCEVNGFPGVVSASAGRIAQATISRGDFRAATSGGENTASILVPCELICGNLAIADGGQLATQELNWRAMLRRRKLKVDNSDPRTLL